jgi:ABC-type multidrug transport system fused ATPase/permease subunit
MMTKQCDHPRDRSAIARYGVATAAALALAVVLGSVAYAQGSAAPAGGGMVARVLPPAEKIKFLEEELTKEIDRRVKLEEQLSRRNGENTELIATTKSLQKERATLESKVTEAREREQLLQRTNDRLREETERVTVSVRFALPVIAGIAIMILALIVWILLYLRQVGSRVHGQRTLSEMHELEGRLIHTNDLLNAEVKRTQALRNKLAEFGISD